MPVRFRPEVLNRTNQIYFWFVRFIFPRRGTHLLFGSDQIIWNLWSIATGWEKDWPTDWYHAAATKISETGDGEKQQGIKTHIPNDLEYYITLYRAIILIGMSQSF